MMNLIPSDGLFVVCNAAQPESSRAGGHQCWKAL